MKNFNFLKIEFLLSINSFYFSTKTSLYSTGTGIFVPKHIKGKQNPKNNFHRLEYKEFFKYDF